MRIDECWRIVKPGGCMIAIFPAPRSNRACSVANKPDHYGVKRDFVSPRGNGIPAIDGQIPMEEGLRAPEVRSVRSNTLLKKVADWVIRMKKADTRETA